MPRSRQDAAPTYEAKNPIFTPWADAIPYQLVCGVMNREASEIVQ